ncbi:class I SAM-dependent methyltransferase [[Mycobacterium] zoologicum]|uniref:class I SAM-dependent methyltransferase n=1 Tax=[Mycobacterium] zoologicum TaxID=2872311 RepID=UPI001CDACF56|nr:SAM-dependent methyltransferase [Mycolicibacter sp. MYC101]MEB3064403.1 SAM-dependent methyltransferase [Mycolicibacter sp. MYC101]
MPRRRLDRDASLTAQTCALQRAAESLQPPHRRLLDDPDSALFVDGYQLLLTKPVIARACLRVLDGYLPGLHVYIVLRVRYTDDVVRQAISTGIDQVVLLGAGFDTTSLRTPATDSGPAIFEVDAPTTQLEKRRLLERANRAVGPGVQWVPCDFETDRLAERLDQAGFDPTRPCVVVWIGVSVYLTRAAIDQTLTDLSDICAPGSLLVTDFGDPETVTGKHHLAGARRTARLVRRRGEPWLTALSIAELTAALNGPGFVVRDQARVADLAKRYAPNGRPWCSTDDWLGVLTAERVRSDGGC